MGGRCNEDVVDLQNSRNTENIFRLPRFGTWLKGYFSLCTTKSANARSDRFDKESGNVPMFSFACVA